MFSFLRLAVLSWALLCSTACTTLEPLKDARPRTVQQAVHVGDEVHLTTRGGQVYDVKVTKIDDRFLYGYDRQVFVKAPFVDIATIGVRVFNPGRTAAATAGGVAAGALVVYTLIIGVGAILLIRELYRLGD